jgi:hypothetical protein
MTLVFKAADPKSRSVQYSKMRWEAIARQAPQMGRQVEHENVLLMNLSLSM